MLRTIGLPELVVIAVVILAAASLIGFAVWRMGGRANR
jgi:hypothetical protein